MEQPSATTAQQDKNQQDTQKRTMTKVDIFLPPDSTYAAIIGENKAAQVDSAMKAIFPRYAPGMRPAYAKMIASLMLNMHMLGLKDASQMQSFKPMDYYVYDMAKKDGKYIARLEDISVQRDILTELARKKAVQAPKDLKAEMLDLYNFCIEYGRAVETADTIRSMYVSGQGKEMVAAILSSQGADGLATDDKNVEKRNRQWMEIIPTLMKNRSTLFIVGIAHLLPYKGTKGIIQSLIDKGYKVELVK